MPDDGENNAAIAENTEWNDNGVEKAEDGHGRRQRGVVAHVPPQELLDVLARRVHRPAEITPNNNQFSNPILLHC